MRATVLTLCCVFLMAVAGCGDADNGDTPSSGPPAGQNGSPDESGRGGTGGGDGLPENAVLAFTPPSGWESATPPADGILAFVYPPGAEDLMLANLQLSTYTIWLVDEKNLAGAAARYIEGLKGYEAIVKNFTVVSSETIQVGNVTAQEIFFTCDAYGGLDKPFKGRVWIAVTETDVYQLIAAFQAADFDAYTPLLDAVGASLRWEAAPPEAEGE